jgi:hypothetical protein
MSNRRKLRPPPTGYNYEKFLRVLMESDLDDEQIEQIALQAAFADKKGKVKDRDTPAMRDVQE